jgi:3-hydroxyisobutyrate dehydrogenase
MPRKKPRIGWIGTGVMGSSMCRHILEGGYSVTLYTRTKEKARGLLDRGAVWAESPCKVGEVADIVFSIVSYPQDVESVYL